MERLESSPISFTDIRNHTTKDPLLSKVRQIVTDGWPDVVDRPDLQSFASVSHELSVESDCLLRGNRMVVPASLQEKVLDLLHDGHPGVVRMKSLARQYDIHIYMHVLCCITLLVYPCMTILHSLF